VNDDILVRDSFKVENLTATEYRRQDFMFFGRSKNKNGIRGGSSSVFRKALKAEELSMCTSSMI
jgi:hypothetical protein